jgi:uncharacterized protein (TIGR02246 family)
MKRVFLSLLVLVVLLIRWAGAQEPSPPAADETAIRKAVESYAAAFNARDAKALADHWSPEAVYFNRISGEQVVGRDKIAEQFTALFKAQPELEIEVGTESIQFLSPNVGVEHGTAKLLAPNAEPDVIEYTAVYVKRDGKWLLDRVTDQAPEVVPSHYEQLKVLEWMVGAWVDEDENARIETECNWTKNRNFLTRSFAVTVGDRLEMSGMQIVGWDPAAKTIRSWTFDSSGGFAEATWKEQKGRWFVHNQGVLADGRKATMVNVIKPVDANSFTWQTIERTAGGELLPNVDEVLIVRK